MTAGMTKRDIMEIQSAVDRFLKDGNGMVELENHVTRLTLTAILIEGVFGTELWRTDGTGHQGRVFAAANRMRFIDSASKLLAELRKAREGDNKITPDILKGILDPEAMGESRGKE